VGRISGTEWVRISGTRKEFANRGRTESVAAQVFCNTVSNFDAPLDGRAFETTGPDDSLPRIFDEGERGAPYRRLPSPERIDRLLDDDVWRECSKRHGNPVDVRSIELQRAELRQRQRDNRDRHLYLTANKYGNRRAALTCAEQKS
jgi:hypothetical protein